MLEDTRPNHAISNVITATKLLLCFVILKRRRRQRRRTNRRIAVFWKL